MVFSMFLAYLIFDPNSHHFAKTIAFAWANGKMADFIIVSFVEDLIGFFSRFLHITILMLL